MVHFQGPWAAESRQEGAGRLSGAMKWSLERLVLASADRVIVMSEAFASLAEQNYGVSRARLRIVPGAVDLRTFAITKSQSEARDTLGLPKDRPVLATVRRLIYRTGVDRLIDALPAIVQEFPRLLLCVGGRRPLRPLRSGVSLVKAWRTTSAFSDTCKRVSFPCCTGPPTSTLYHPGFGRIRAHRDRGSRRWHTVAGHADRRIARSGSTTSRRWFSGRGRRRHGGGYSGALSGSTSMPTAEQCQRYAREHFSADLMARRIATVYHEVCA